ncbi:MAG: ABC transporter permease, partial [archaeon]
MDTEFVFNALSNLRRQGVRTFLTLIGVIIGVAAIVSLLSMGEGLNIAVEKQFEMFGSNMIFIYPGNLTGVAPGGLSGTSKITAADLRQIEAISG